MKDEKQDRGLIKISEIPYRDNLMLIKSFLNEEDRSKIYNFVEQHQKDRLFLLNDNLINTERTDWHYHYNQDFRPFYDIIYRELHECMNHYSVRIGYGDASERSLFDKVKCKIFMLNSWYAKCRKEAFIEPHHHGYGHSLYSFVCYLRIPSLKSSLNFANSDISWSNSVSVREGDILVFPSHLKHWSKDTEEGRAIFSGNFVWETTHHCECEDCSRTRVLDEQAFSEQN